MGSVLHVSCLHSDCIKNRSAVALNEHSASVTTVLGLILTISEFRRFISRCLQRKLCVVVLVVCRVFFKLCVSLKSKGICGAFSFISLSSASDLINPAVKSFAPGAWSQLMFSVGFVK